MAELIAQPLTAEAFAPFGDVIETRGAEHFPINGGRCERYHDLARVQLEGEGARPLISIFRSAAVTRPVVVDRVERHPLGSQAFMPLAGQRFLVVVAPPGSEPAPDALAVFMTDGRQGVNYHAGVWHAPLLALESESDFLVVDRGGPGANCDEILLARPVRIAFD